jgi:hypothetical protein
MLLCLAYDLLGVVRMRTLVYAVVWDDRYSVSYSVARWSLSTAALILAAALKPCRVKARTGGDVPPGVQPARHGFCPARRQRLHRRMRSSTSRAAVRRAFLRDQTAGKITPPITRATTRLRISSAP